MPLWQKKMNLINVVIIGAKGYAGEELIKTLSKHPKVKIVSLSDKMNGTNVPISEIYPHIKTCPEFISGLDLLCEDVNTEKISEIADVVFTALPHMVSMEIVSKFITLGKKVID